MYFKKTHTHTHNSSNICKLDKSKKIVYTVNTQVNSDEQFQTTPNTFFLSFLNPLYNDSQVRRQVKGDKGLNW